MAVATSAQDELADLEADAEKLAKDLAKLNKAWRKIDEKYLADHREFMAKDQEIQAALTAVSDQLPAARIAAQEEELGEAEA